MNSALAAKSPLGIFAFSESGKLVYYKLFNRNPHKALAEFEGKVPENFVEGCKTVEDSRAYAFLRENVREYATSFCQMSNEEFNRLVSDFCVLLSRKSMKIERDKFLIQANNALNDLEKMVNYCCERIGEWFGLHYPELKSSRMDLVDKIIKYGSREKFPDFADSTGIELLPEDESAVTGFAAMLKGMSDERIRLEKYVSDTVKEIMPNFSSLVDPLLAAKMLSLAGSQEKLARMPASTIQLLGSEKALFRHLKKQGKSPKYGVLYIDKRIQAAPKEKKGKVARIIASNLMMAARIDFYSKRLEGKLKEDMEKEISSVGVQA